MVIRTSDTPQFRWRVFKKVLGEKLPQPFKWVPFRVVQEMVRERVWNPKIKISESEISEIKNDYLVPASLILVTRIISLKC